MAELTIISETGMFHSACRCTFPTIVEWYGFQPAVHRRPICAGKVDFSDRTPYINHFIRMTIDDTTLRHAVAAAVTKFSAKRYALGVSDCVSFSAEVARQCRLRVPMVNMTPYGFIEVLSWWNDYDEFK